MEQSYPERVKVTETHTLRELYDKLKARSAELNPKEFIHRFPDADGHFDTLKGDYKPDQDPTTVDTIMTDVKRRKKSIRPADWYKYNYVDTFREDRLPWIKEANSIDEKHINENAGVRVLGIDRFDHRDVSYDWWVANYEQPAKPCMISGFCDDWTINKFTYKTMNHSFLRDEKVKVGKDDEGYRIGIETKYYLQYCSDNKDDSPVYLFESQVAANDNIKKILETYSRPSWFAQDLFHYCHVERRPPHRWLCVGPERSGTTMHLDPLQTNAFNSVIAGRKLWILFPPQVSEDLACGNPFFSKEKLTPNIENEAIGWFDRVYPKLKQHVLETGNKLGMIECIQYPGETIFVPGRF